MLKRVLVVVLSGAAIVLNTTTVFLAGSLALGPAKSIASAMDELSAERAAEARARVAAIREKAESTERSSQEISKVRKVVGQPTPHHSLIVR